MANFPRSRCSYRYCYLALLLMAVAALILYSKFDDGAGSSDAAPVDSRSRASNSRNRQGDFHTPNAVISSKPTQRHALVTNLKAYEQVSSTRNLRRGGIIIGKPVTPLPSARTPLTALVQPTPQHPTWPMKPLHFLRNKVMRSTDEILSAPWIAELRHMLDTMSSQRGTGKQTVSIVFADLSYLESVLNWLIAARVRLDPPLANTIVFCLSEPLYKILHARDIPAIYIDPETVTNTNQILFKYTVWMVRFIVYRLLNYLGHNIVSYDADAIVLRNPQKLFEEHQYSDVISSAGKFPFSLSRSWGFTACMGVILFRSTPRMELLWDSMQDDGLDDQILLNTALNNCHIQWQSRGRDIHNHPIDGQCDNGLRVTVLPHSNICRYKCDASDQQGMSGVYVWHRLSKKSGSIKKFTAKESKVWFLRDDWNTLSNADKSLKDVEWLSALSGS